ncbi:MAG: toxin-antitoxin system HicB family antitoxin [Merismopedia sp. SIO2A8]|nr:toxin-antitoxin system HicB family antitoxin [Merismopedia sp. SIO2A8]
MSTLNIQLPDSLYRNLQQLADQDGISLDQFVALAIAEKISALTTEDYLQGRASRGDRTRYANVLAKIPDGEPESYDKLPSA